jgi:AraC family transcriptional regulator of adaptative response / DNA-3-methyladenine glycosylase II
MVTPSQHPRSLDLHVRFPEPRALLSIVEKVRRIFDLGADPHVIAEHLGADPLLRAALRRHTGIRTPGAWDGFELAVRAIVGQQISVRAATTMMGRIAATFGTPLDCATGLAHRSLGEGGLSLIFPTAHQLKDAVIERVGIIPARAEAIRELARRVSSGSIAFSTFGDTDRFITLLKEIPGIGDWTAQYIAMRALGEPDAFPSGDLVLRRVLGNCSARDVDKKSAAWRPWRAYAVMLLWESANEATPHPRRVAVVRQLARARAS